MSNTILKPAITDINELSPVSSTLTIEPLASGYGQTLGNSLRRVLLSSIEGTAITAFKIDGVGHEFTTIPGVKEDVVEIMLNLKSVVLKSHSDEPVEFTVTKRGGTLTAADLAGSADFDVVDDSQVIATIDDPNCEITLTIVVEQGRGYQTIEESSVRRLHSDMIALDAPFSPVRRVRYNVEKTRVGDNVDLDKLILTVDTDGSITPNDAFEQAAAILVNQYKALAGQTVVAEDNTEDTTVDDATSGLLSMSVEELGMSARTTNALISNEIHTVSDLVSLSDEELDDLKGFGAKAKEEVKARVAELEF